MPQRPETRGGARRGLGATRRGRRGRARLALVTPWPPEPSGVADYSWQLAAALAHHVDLDVVVAGSAFGHADPRLRGVSLVGATSARLLSRLRRSNRILYCMGNSEAHAHVYELLCREPGAVLLHDAQLTGFFGWYAGRERPDDPLGRLAERVEQDYGARIPAAERLTAPLSFTRRPELGIYLTGEIQRHAQELLVHSSFARAVVERDGRLTGSSVAVRVMPFGMPPPRSSPVRAAAAAPPLVVHMGVVSEIKGIAELIEAFARFSTGHPGARLVVAGPSDEHGLERWREFARERAPAAAIELTGRLDDERYLELLGRADLAVQLRLASNGEASGAVADCLAAGVPTIVTALGWMGELPASAVEHVPLGAPPELLAARMHELIVDSARRAALGEGARAHARACSFARVAEAYVAALALA
jgi:glycosyltransferase involved in cell wall biosynthesis